MNNKSIKHPYQFLCRINKEKGTRLKLLLSDESLIDTEKRRYAILTDSLYKKQTPQVEYRRDLSDQRPPVGRPLHLPSMSRANTKSTPSTHQAAKRKEPLFEKMIEEVRSQIKVEKTKQKKRIADFYSNE